MRKRFAKICNKIFLYLIHYPLLIGFYLVILIKYSNIDDRIAAIHRNGEPLFYRIDSRLMKALDKIEGSGHHWFDNYEANFTLSGLNKGE